MSTNNVICVLYKESDEGMLALVYREHKQATCGDAAHWFTKH